MMVGGAVVLSVQGAVQCSATAFDPKLYDLLLIAS